MLTSKLPSGMMERWNREVLKKRGQQHGDSNLEDFTLLFSWQVHPEYLSRMFIERRLEKEESSKLQVQSDESQIKKDENVDQNLAKKKKAVFFVMAVTT